MAATSARYEAMDGSESPEELAAYFLRYAEAVAVKVLGKRHWCREEATGTARLALVEAIRLRHRCTGDFRGFVELVVRRRLDNVFRWDRSKLAVMTFPLFESDWNDFLAKDEVTPLELDDRFEYLVRLAPAECREFLRLAYRDGLYERGIAARLGRSLQFTHDRLVEGREAIRAALAG